MLNWTQKDTDFLYTLCEKLRDNIPFAFSRWGDGEWLTISQVQPKATNIDGNFYYPELGERLHQIVSTKQSYYMGHQNVNGYTIKNNYNQDWVNSDIFHEFSEKEGLSYLIKLLITINVVYIGNKALRALPFINEFIEIPTSNVWQKYDNVLGQIKNIISEDVHKTFLFSAGMATEVFIDDLWTYNQKNTYVDVGSVFDPYVGKTTRSYHKRLDNIQVYI